MSNPTILAIESNPTLLQEYGKALAWANFIESRMNLILLYKSNLHNADSVIQNRILEETTFGPRIELVRKFLPHEKTYKKLKQLAINRNIIAHNLAGEDYKLDVETQSYIKTGEFIVQNKNKEHKFEDLLKEIITLAKEIDMDFKQIDLVQRF